MKVGDWCVMAFALGRESVTPSDASRFRLPKKPLSGEAPAASSSRLLKKSMFSKIWLRVVGCIRVKDYKLTLVLSLVRIVYVI